MSKPYGTTKCYEDINSSIKFIDSVFNNLLLSLNQNEPTYISKKLFINSVKSSLMTKYSINNRDVNYVLNKLSCIDYCTLNGKALLDNNICKCIDPKNSLKEFGNTYRDNLTNKDIIINSANCLTPLENFNEQISVLISTLDNYSNSIGNPININIK